MPTGVAFRMASKNSVRNAARGTVSPPNARASSLAAFSGRSTRPEDQDAAAFEAKLFLERTKHAEVIGVATIKRTVAANDHGVNGANFRGERIALLQILEDSLLVRMSDAEPVDSKFGNGSQKIAKIMHKKWEINGVHMAGDKACIVQ